MKLKLGSIFGTGSSPELGKPGLPEGGDAITAEARFDHTQRLVSLPSPLHCTALNLDIIAHEDSGLQSPLHSAHTLH